MEVDSSLKNYLLSIYEERLGNKVLKRRSISNITKICDGKFPLIVDGQIIFMVVLNNYNKTFFLCKSSTSLYGPVNGKILNIETMSFFVDIRFSVFKTFLLIQEELKNNFQFFVGIILEKSKEYDEKSSLRFSLRHEYLNTEVLKIMKKIFRPVRFSSTTMHLLSMNQVDQIMAIDKESPINVFLTCLIKNDEIYPKKF